MRSSSDIFDELSALAEGRTTGSLVELFNELEVAVLVDIELPSDVYEKAKALLTAHGFRMLAESTKDEGTRAAAVERLRSLSVNADDAIRKEAIEELRRLADAK